MLAVQAALSQLALPMLLEMLLGRQLLHVARCSALLRRDPLQRSSNTTALRMPSHWDQEMPMGEHFGALVLLVAASRPRPLHGVPVELYPGLHPEKAVDV